MMKLLPIPRVIRFAIPLSLGCLASAHGATVSWDGGGGNPNWGTANNWDPNTVPGASDDVNIDVNTSLNGSRRLNVDQNVTVQSYSSTVNNLMTRSSGGSQTFTVGANDTGEASSINLNLNRTVGDNSFAGTNANNTLYVEFGHQLTLTHTGSGETTFGNARLRNTSSSTGTDTVFFAGSGDWAFVVESYSEGTSAASALEKNSANATLDVELQSGANAFTGTLRYASTNALSVDNLRINSGTLLLDSSTIATTGSSTTTGLTVGEGGTLAGAGSVFGSATVNGSLELGGGTAGENGTITFENGLTLQSSAQVEINIDGLGVSAHDMIVLNGGDIGYGGDLDLIVSGDYAVGDSWTIFSGFDSTEGSFGTVTLNGVNLSQDENLWTGYVNGDTYQFNELDGTLSVVIPEPQTTIFLIGGLAMLFPLLRRFFHK